jgi:uncharacterized repeat protein (TIGR01451 family)
VTYTFTSPLLAQLAPPAGWTVVNATTWTDTVTLSGGAAPNSPVTPNLPAGSYQFQASYSGDGNYAGSTSALEPLAINQGTSDPTTAILDAVTNQPPKGVAGESIFDTATVTGSPAAFTPTGTVTYEFFTNATGSGTPASTQTVTLNPDGTVPNSAVHGPLGVGAFSFIAIYSGDSNYQGGTSPVEPLTLIEASPMLTTVPNETMITLGDTTPPLLTDTAELSGGFNPTGTITFELFQGNAVVDTETVTVSGNGSYMTPTGFRLPTSGIAADDYQWVASYSGDANNNPAIDTNADDEKVTVSPANPMISTTPVPTRVTPGTSPVTLTDTAVLSGGYHPTGTLTFMLFHNGSSMPVDIEAVTVSGNGSYTTPTGFTLPTTDTMTSIYQWNTSYSGDPNNNSVSDDNATNEQVTVGGEADLSITKKAGTAQVIMGENVTFTLTVHNDGPSVATDVIVSDPLPTGLFFLGIGAISQGSVNAAGDVWSVGTLSVGATASAQIITQVIAIGPITNSASVKADQFDPDTSNNHSTAAIAGLVPPPLISKRPFLTVQDDPSAFDGTNQRFIAHLYSNMLHRESDVDGLANWSLLLASGGTRNQVVLGIETSPEYRADEVEGIYGRFLHRSAGPAEVGAWLNLFSSGTTLEQMEAVVMGSPEYYQSRAGSSTMGFLNALYGDVLGRAVDAVGLAGWSQALADGATRTEVAGAVLASSEGDADWIESVYQKYLHRPADPTGLSSWSNQLKNGAAEEQVLALILASDEYFKQP